MKYFQVSQMIMKGTTQIQYNQKPRKVKRSTVETDVMLNCYWVEMKPWPNDRPLYAAERTAAFSFRPLYS